MGPSGPMLAWETTWTSWPSGQALDPPELSIKTESVEFFSTLLHLLKPLTRQPVHGQFLSKSVFISMLMTPLVPLRQRPTEMMWKMIQLPPLVLVLATAASTWPTGRILAKQ